jgi:solute carrier family 25 citrate transporter 1
MSAKNVGGVNGKKPASAATNLIGEYELEVGGSESNAHANILAAGGAAGMMEALVCHPLGKPSLNFQKLSRWDLIFIDGIKLTKRCIDTIKVRMQLSRRGRAPGVKKRGFVATGAEIVKRETPLGLYKGLGAVVTGIVPKMAIRFTSFEAYKQLLADDKGVVSGKATFLGEFISIFEGFSDCAIK